MEYIRVKTITESDFDNVIASAGGTRICKDGSADYVLNEAFIELKLVKEEGFDKTERQRKLAELFRKTQPDVPVVVMNPRRLSDVNLREYYRIVEVPIKNACKKASKQLQATAETINPMAVRVLVILNIGYTLLSLDEFKEVSLKCIRNDTSGIDWVMCGGVYFFSDKADNFVLAPLEAFPINVSRAFVSNDILVSAWGKLLDDFMTSSIRNPELLTDSRMPVLDLKFDLDGIRYIKPSPKMPQSEFWPDGVAPRENTTGINSCPPVARTFPSLSLEEWLRFRDAMPSVARLETTYDDWLESYPNENEDSLKPLILTDVTFEDFARAVTKEKSHWLFTDLAQFANEAFHHRAISLFEAAKNKEEIKIIPLNYVYLEVNEIGNDKANDFASIYYVSEVPGFEREELIVKNAKLFFEYGLAVAAAYAIKRNVDVILFSKRSIR